MYLKEFIIADKTGMAVGTGEKVERNEFYNHLSVTFPLSLLSRNMKDSYPCNYTFLSTSVTDARQKVTGIPQSDNNNYYKRGGGHAAEEEIIHVEYKLISSFSPWQNKNVNNMKKNPIRELLPPFCNIHLFAVLTADSSLVCCPLSKRNESNQ